MKEMKGMIKLNKSDKIALELIKFSGKTFLYSFREIFYFIKNSEYKLKKNFIPLTGCTIGTIYLISTFDIGNLVTYGLIPFTYFTPRTAVKQSIYQLKRKRMQNILNETNLNKAFYIKEKILDDEIYDLKFYIFYYKNLLKKFLGLKYERMDHGKRKKIYFRNQNEIEDWLNKKKNLEVLLNTNIESIAYWKNYKFITLLCNKEKIDYEKIYSNLELSFNERLEACLKSLGYHKYQIESYDLNDFCSIARIKTSLNIKNFIKMKMEIAHRLQLEEDKLNIYSEDGLIIFKASLKMKNLSFIDEYSKLTKLNKYRIPIYIGKNEEGKNILFDMLDWYHWLIAGSTGQGKSNLLNVILSCIFLNRNNKIAKFYLLDIKKVELSRYKELDNVVYKNTEISILEQLFELKKEMNNRYKIFESRGCLDIEEWNEKFTNEKIGYNIVIIEEIANLMLSENKKLFHKLFQELGQFSRGAGFRIILITQCANGDIIKKTIKLNYINRICTQVDDWNSSKVVLDSTIATTLKNPGEVILKLSNKFDKIKVPLINKKERKVILNKLNGE